ncbi:pyridoxamine 5'-phosphate oxidase [Devosia sp.]|uniref:pyridoxamine 5'-phosphate oxidase n=1 Tax=Devosia sp. TaxID=1871048 RepID=UPI002F1DD7C8
MPTATLSDRLFDDADTGSIDPFLLFEEWFAEAQAGEVNDPNAMTLASVDAAGLPDARIVLLNARDRRGFVFFTNFDSAKGAQLHAHPQAALLFHWKSLRRQVRLRGPVETVAPAEADAYFATRPRISQIGAHASLQSQPLAGREALMARVDSLEQSLPAGEPVPRPNHWGGFRLVPLQMEFWKDGAFRLHDRVLFTRPDADTDWARQRLYP